MTDQPSAKDAARPPLSADWEVPASKQLVFGPRRTRHACVIPVINEGDRILRQLETMRRLDVPGLCDVIIADGGSTDGSMDADGLARLGVRALLTKTGAGKLSAQLRMAYAWILGEGYEGVVTIDGNGKDSVESIPAFVAALDRGIDYAQASRFIKGGVSENAPISRSLAIRLIHAPLISMAARRRLTDTTQGFRAYSARYLTHPDVQPFRDIFMDYELLAYLSIRASQLGLQVEEIPTRRSYPRGEVTPTKINGLAGQLGLMATLLRAVAGAYHPRKRGRGAD